VAEPLIPYIKLPEIPLSFLEHLPLIGRYIDPREPPSIKPFGTLVALGVYIGSLVAVRHARERRLDERKMNEFIFWVVAAGFIGGHMLDAVFYHPQRIARDPFYLFALWDGLSSFGGFVGALSGALAWRLFRGEGILAMCEVVNSAFPLAWVFGRAGCASVHDHPGRISDAWFAVRYPFGSGTVGRFDLGLYECVLTIPLAVAFLILWRRKPVRPLGFYTGIMCTAYAPVRFALDFLREQEGTISGGDPRYAGLTPAQWACFGLLAVGIYFLRLARRSPAPGSGDGETAAEAEGPAADADEPAAADAGEPAADAEGSRPT
jgi:phosphatidylglycerol:prolipoprotein diacylglycerol transferase